MAVVEAWVSVGLHAIDEHRSDLYIDGAFVQRRINLPEHPRTYGDKITIGAFDRSGTWLDAHVGRIEFRDAPVGALLDADDFDTLAGWTGTVRYSSPVILNPPGYASRPAGDRDGVVSWRTQPAGTRYVEFQDVYIENSPTEPVYFAFAFDRNAGDDSLNGPSHTVGGGTATPMAARNEGRGVYIASAASGGIFVPFTAPPGRRPSLGRLGFR